jgi:DNA-binding CsgD family transcriptional regulator
MGQKEKSESYIRIVNDVLDAINQQGLSIQSTLERIASVCPGLHMIGYMKIIDSNTLLVEEVIGQDDLVGSKLTIAHTIFHEALIGNDEMYIWQDLSFDPRYAFFIQRNIHFKSFFIFPIRVYRELVGFIFGGSKKKECISSIHVSIIRYIVKLVELKMAQTKISHHLDRHLMRLATTLELSKTIVEVTEPKDVLGMLMDLCLQLTHAETALFILKNGMYEIKGERGNNPKLSSYIHVLENKYFMQSVKKMGTDIVQNPLGVFLESPLWVKNKTEAVLAILIKEEAKLKESEVYLSLLSRIGEFALLNLKTPLLNENEEGLVQATLPNQISRILTKREMEVLQCVIRGLNNKEISKELYISIHTVKNHLTHIFNKLGVTDRAETIAFIYRLCYGQEL